MVVEKMGQRKVTFKWKQLYEVFDIPHCKNQLMQPFPFRCCFYISDTLKQAKLKEREEATQKSLDRIKQRYQEEDASQYLYLSSSLNTEMLIDIPLLQLPPLLSRKRNVLVINMGFL